MITNPRFFVEENDDADAISDVDAAVNDAATDTDVDNETAADADDYGDYNMMIITTSFSSMIKVVGALPTVQVVPGVVLLAEKIENIKNIK